MAKDVAMLAESWPSTRTTVRERVSLLAEYKTGVRVREGESFESAIRRFKKDCEKAGILSDVRKHEVYEKPSVRRKKKSMAARKRALKRRDR